MKKTEQLIEVFIDENEAFKKNIEVLNEIQKKSFKLDTISIKKEINSGIKSMQICNQEFLKEFQSMINAIEFRNQIPNYVWTSIFGFVLILLVSVSSNFYQYQKLSISKEESIKLGESKVIGHFSAFFSDYPEAKKKYDLWIKNSSTQKQ